MAWTGYIGLGTISSGVFTEFPAATYPAYARQPFAFGDPASGKVAGAGGAITFPVVTGGTAWTHDALAFFDNATTPTPTLVYPHASAGMTVAPGTALTVHPARIVVDIADNTTATGVALSLSAAGAITGAPDSFSRSQSLGAPRSAGFRRVWLPISNVSAPGNITAAVWTLSSQWTTETDFDLVRLVYLSPVATGYTIQKATVAPTSAVGDGHSPVNAAGSQDATLLTQVFFNNAGANVAPQDQTTWGSGTATLSVPGNSGSLNQPPVYFSDWVRVSSLARTDGGTLPLLIARTLSDALGTMKTAPFGARAAFQAYIAPRQINAYGQQADRLTTPALLVSPSLLSNIMPYGIEYVSRSLGYTVMCSGDSLTQGANSTGSMSPWGWLSCSAISTPARPITFWNGGWTGQVSSDYWTNAYNAFKACKPDIVTFPAWSPNDGLTQAAADACWSRAMDFCHYVRSQGSIPVIMGPLPWTSVANGTQEAARLSARTRMLQVAANPGIFALDWESTMGTGAALNRLQAQYDAGNSHPNDLGNQVMDQQVFRPVLKRIIGAT